MKFMGGYSWVAAVWRGGVVVRASIDVAGSSPGRSASRNDSGATCSHTMCLCSPSSIIWYRPLAGKVTVGLVLINTTQKVRG